MAEDVVVQFGAKIDELNKGVDEAKGKIESFKESTDKVVEGLRTLAEVAGIGFGVEAIKHFVESMGELGLQTERTMAMLGISAEAVGQLGGIAKLTGTSMEGMALSIERMSLNIQRSTRDGTNPASQALKALGLSAKELIGLPADQYFGKLADAVSKFNPSLNLTNALMAVGGRGVQQMLPALLQGRERFEEWNAAIQATGSVMNEFTTKQLAGSHEQITLLGLSMQGLGIAIFTAVKPAVDGIVQSFTDLVQWMRTAGSEGGALSDLFRGVTAVVKGLATALATLVSSFEALIGIVGLGAGLIAGEGEKAWDAWGKGLDEIYVKWKRTYDTIWHDSNTLHLDIAKRGNVAPIDFGAKGSQNAAVEALKAEIDAATAAFDLEKDRLGSMVKLHEITHTQETAALLRALDVREAAETTAQEKIIATYSKGSAEYQKAQNELTKIADKAALERQKINEKEQEQNVKEWTSAIDAIKGAWDSQIKGLLEGTKTWADAMRSIVEDLVIDVIKELEKIAVEKAALALGTGLGGPTALLGGLGGILGFQVGTDYVPQTGLALVHEGEAIIPASRNPAASGAGVSAGGGGSTINISINALDGTSVQRIAPMLARQISQLMNNNPTMRPAY